ncbi:short-subunit dehydrogenase [Saonia flava]|uniref:Short-subunit dehydrogenase n=1 Tax=Saonia flava TaxID=523696 RepID=A0A846R119_9FLAO|nr:SDR family NAD(P)-dependent oxidoreductase [Saonia flava]NJB71635.1 short-subunit dehydrogenase [Saonia flava]
MKKLDLKDKTVWITGASSGIGESLAIQLNQMGAKVIASARRTEKLSELKKQSPNPHDLLTLPMDITNPNSIEKAVAQTKQLDRLDLVIHNSGISQKGLVIENEMEVDRKIMETNYFGTVALTKSIMPIFLEQGYGWFGVVSSFAGVMGIPGRSAYSASKHALHGFFNSLRAENMDCELNISFILPGFINTEITAKGLCGDGKPYGKVETSHQLGISASECADGIIKGLMKKNKRIVVGKKFELLMLTINRISPEWGHYIIKNHPMRRMRNVKSKINRTLYFKKNSVVKQ